MLDIMLEALKSMGITEKGDFNARDIDIFSAASSLMKSMPTSVFTILSCITANACRFFSHGDIISFGHHELKVLHTPGHTPGGVSFYCVEEKLVFTGDTLFRPILSNVDQ